MARINNNNVQCYLTYKKVVSGIKKSITQDGGRTESACTESSCCIIVDLYIWMKPLVPVIRGENVTTCKASPASPIVMLDVRTVRCVSDSIPTALFPHGPD